ncbi:hypothetical protein PLICRDRAFT_96537 [Plicaturopsis crispa FD-325 SS-3]|nr:hypothetical protein PLICRDRAFT_96537 [Plicaturopsis crispa FD-325 SS-3]
MPRPRSLRSLAISPTNPRRNASPGPPSPTFSEATHASAMNFGANGPEKIITRANLKASMQAYEDLMTTSANYRAALLTMSKATAAFANSMEACSALKGPSYEAGTRLQAASGLHHLIGNHWHVLAETLDKNFEKPLRQHLETYRTIVNERSAAYERALHEKSQIIRQTEINNMNRKERNLQSFREALTVLQRQVDELDDLKANHYQEIVEHEEEVWDVVQGKTCIVVRSTMDVFDRFTAKASDPVIEPMLQSVPDPFDSYGPPQAEDQIFSILPPLSIIGNAPSPSPSPSTPGVATPDRELSGDSSRRNSWVPPSNGFFPEGTSEWADVPSALTPSSTPPRSVSPPNRRSSHPPSSGHLPRKSESKLRSVLSVIDESHGRQASDSSVTTLTPDLPPSSSGITNGGNPDPPDSWGFTYGQSPYSDAESTPRNSSLFSSQQAIPPDSVHSEEPTHVALTT